MTWLFKKHSDNMIFSFREIKKEAKKYEGYDWTEVYWALGISVVGGGLDMKSDANQALYKRLRDEIDIVLASIYMIPGTPKISERSKQVLLVCRAYCWAAGRMKNSHSYLQPVWRGLSEVRDDSEFLKLYSELFPYIWD